MARVPTGTRATAMSGKDDDPVDPELLVLLSEPDAWAVRVRCLRHPYRDVELVWVRTNREPEAWLAVDTDGRIVLDRNGTPTHVMQRGHLYALHLGGSPHGQGAGASLAQVMGNATIRVYNELRAGGESPTRLRTHQRSWVYGP